MRISFFNKVWVTLVGLLLAVIVGSGLILYWAIQAQQKAVLLVADNLDQAAVITGLRMTALEQSGLISLYLLDPVSARLEAIERVDQQLAQQLDFSERWGWEPDQKEYLIRIREIVGHYKQQRTTLANLMLSGKLPEARSSAEKELERSCSTLCRLCESLDAANNRDIEFATGARQLNARRVSFWAWVSLVLAVTFITGLLWFFFRSMLKPLARMAEEADQYVRPEDSRRKQDELGVLGRYIHTLKTEAQEARSHLEQTHHHLMDAEKLAAVGRLAAGIAHEIRSPLTALKLRLYSMQQALGSHSRYGAELQIMSDEISRLDGIIRNFLEFSRPPEIRLGRHDLSSVLNKTVELLRFRCDAGRILVEFNADVDLPDVLADEQQLRQVFLNLLNNAIDAQPDGGVIRLSVQRERDVDGGEVLCVRVSDGGLGIPAALQAQIFEPFFSTKNGGAGLGLWIAQRIVKEHGGQLQLERSNQQGTTFIVRLPVNGGNTNE